jgi:uncharacterized protein (TIGR03435 family)
MAIAAASVGMWVAIAAAQQPQFDVVSVKRSVRPVSGVIKLSAGRLQPDGRWVASFATLKQLLETAYPGHTMAGQIAGGPDWLARDRFDIVATLGAARSPEQIESMVRNMLRDRFHLAVHTEQREQPAYALVLAGREVKLGDALAKSDVDCDAYRAARGRGESPAPGTLKPGAPLPCSIDVRPSATETAVVGTAVTFADLAVTLSAHAGRPVVDDTGLGGRWDVALRFSERAFSTDTRDPAVSNAPSVFDAIQRQLGLRLEPSRRRVDTIVVDDVAAPAPD